MYKINSLGFDKAIKEAVLIHKTPILGICLGMQLLTQHSEEGDIQGLGLLDAQTLLIPKQDDLKIPHMGWNSIIPQKKSTFSENIKVEDLVYFVHSYYVKCNKKEDILFSTEYSTTFHSGFQDKNIIGFQFHPEKSYNVGLRLLEYFANL